VLQLDGDDLEFFGRPLTFGWYLRLILNRGGIGLVAGYNDDPIDPDLLNYLTEGLQPF
jgi:hypothetical protein